MGDRSGKGPWDVLVLGAGAAGLLAGIRAAASGAATLILEKNSRPGLKILASGGGRCNLTTTLSGAALEARFPDRQGAFLRFALRAFPPARVRAFFEQEGVTTHEEPPDKVFPDAGRASVVLQALVRAYDKAGGVLACGRSAQGVSCQGDAGFRVVTADGIIEARQVVLAVGGKSFRRLGTTGDGYGIAASLGHTVTPLLPALVGLTVSNREIRELAGITLEEVVTEVLIGERVAMRERRPLLFTHRGLSGPGPMNAARLMSDRGAGRLRVDFLPGLTFQELERLVIEATQRNSQARMAAVLPEELPVRLRRFLVRAAGIGAARSAAVLEREERRRLIHAVKAHELTVNGTLGWDRAEVTRGGVALEEVQSRTMESKKVSGLYVIGEVLDVDGPIGGLNFQAAFATGYLAGEAAGKR